MPAESICDCDYVTLRMKKDGAFGAWRRRTQETVFENLDTTFTELGINLTSQDPPVYTSYNTVYILTYFAKH